MSLFYKFSALILLSVFLVVSSSRAGGLSRRSAYRARRPVRAGQRPRPNRNALNAPVLRRPAYALRGNTYNDSYSRRALRSVFKFDARGGGTATTIGQIMSRGKENEISRRRSAARWSQGSNILLRAGRAVRNLAGKMARR